jgi:hypothetical protein
VVLVQQPVPLFTWAQVSVPLLDEALLEDELLDAAELDAAELDAAAELLELEEAATEEELLDATTDDTAALDELAAPPVADVGPVDPDEIVDEPDVALGELFASPPSPLVDDPTVAGDPPCPVLVTLAALVVDPGGWSTRSVP